VKELMHAVHLCVWAEVIAFCARGTSAAGHVERDRCAAYFRLYESGANRERACAIVAAAAARRIENVRRDPELYDAMRVATAMAIRLQERAARALATGTAS
jgi:hypothetical protein